MSSGYLREGQREELSREIKGIEAALANPIQRAGIAEPGTMVARKRRLESQLASLTPPDTSPAERDALAKEEKVLREFLQEGLPSDQEMRRMPPGAVGKHQRWEKQRAKALVPYIDHQGNRREQAALSRWKDIRLRLNKGDPDRDLANFEQFRPRDSTLNMHNSVVQGATYIGTHPSEAYKEGWLRTFGGGEEEGQRDAEFEAMKAELAELKAMIQASPPSPSPSNGEAKPKPKPQRKANLVEMPCGEMKDPRGKRWHVKACAKCKEIEGVEAA